ncbi:hypothetical protein N665_0411s0041 [Sinapis alba]|nr:hypothetical protein N665_0411s0041 [Sinapis alba]
MTDRARRICDELKVCREEAIFYLEGFDWNLDAAMEACRSKTLQLPSLKVESPPEKEKSSPKVLSPLPSTTGSQSRNELIVQFFNFAVGSDIQDATSYLERNDWDLQRAVLQFGNERRPTPFQRKLNRKLGRLNSQQYLHDETSAAAETLELMRKEQVPKATPLMVSSQLKVQESTSLVQDGEEKLSPVKEFAETPPSSMSSSQREEESIKSFFKVAIGASREAAIACLSHCKWNQDDAISYFFGDYTEATPGTIQESTSPVQTREEKLSPVKESAEAPPSSMSSSQLPYSPEEQLSQLKEEIIKSFRDVVIVASRKAAKACLSHCKWDPEDAISYFFGDYTEANPGIAWSQADGKAVDRDSSTESLEEAKSHVKIQESSSPTQTRKDSRTSSNQLQSSREQHSQLNDELINSFVELADGVVTRDVATVYLTLSNWNVEKAFSCLLEETSSQVQASHGSPNKNYLEEDETGSSSSSSNADPTETGAVPEDASSQVVENVKDKDVEEDLGTELSPVPITTTTTIELEIILDVGGSGIQVWIPFRSDQTVRDIRKRIDWFRPNDKRDYYLKSDTGVEYRDLDTTVHIITSGSRGSTILHQLYSS